MLLIFSPVAKACEPPAGISRLAGFLRGNNQECTLWDANLEGQLYLLKQKQSPVDTWSKRAWKNVQTNIEALKSQRLYNNNDRYQRAVRDTNRALTQSCTDFDINISLADYQDTSLSPHRSRDLLRCAEEYKNNIFFPFFKKRLPELLARQNDPWIGISINYLSQAVPAFTLAGLIKKEYPTFNIIAGGGLITSWLRSPAWVNPFTKLFKHLIAGPGEESLLKILTDTPSSGYQSPEFTGLSLDKYLAPGLILPYNGSTGCYWNRCSFCPEKAEGNPYMTLPSEQIIKDLHMLVDKYNPGLIHMLDNAVAPALMKHLIRDPVGAPWYGFARVSRELSSLEFCRDLKNSGCVMLKLGIESGSQEVLDAMDKGINLELVEKSLWALKKAGIATYVYLLFGTPSETIDRARQTLDFTVRNADGISFLNLAVFNLPRYSTECNTLELRNFSDGDLGLYSDFKHPLGWNRQEVRKFLSSEFKAHPVIRPILQRDPPFFTSNHAPLLARNTLKDNEE